MGINLAILQGNLGADPEMKYSANGTAITTFRIAVSEYRGSGDDRKEHTEWFTVVTWNRLAENCGQHLAKGRSVLVQGRIVNRSWDGKDGQKHYRTEIVANQVAFLGGKGGSGNAVPHEAFEEDDIPFGGDY